MSFGTVAQLFLLACVIFMFLISFCGLLHKIRKTYENEQLLAQRFAARRVAERLYRDSDSSIYVLPLDDSGIFPTGPPPYTEQYEAPPKYEEVIKIQMDFDNSNEIDRQQQRTTDLDNANVATTSHANNTIDLVYTISSQTNA